MPKSSASREADKRDRYRVLLTEVLPYEVPLWFTNDYFHDACCRGLHLDEDKPLGKLRAILGSSARIPYSYWVIRDEGDVRELSVMHPMAQLSVVDFYEKYDEILLHFCSRSRQTLRAPTKVVSRFYEETGERPALHGVEEEDREKSYCSSYFSYRKYAFLYRFFESYDYHSLEKRFRHMHQVDIAMCFASIYTHSISWALKSKTFAKKTPNTAVGFDIDFDRLMSKSNYGETNGILIGPEISRIFAEVILQEADARLIRAMEAKEKKLRSDYDFRRFVDDYFIFASDHSDCEEVVDELSRVLAEFKLHLHPMKREYVVRPFISQLSLCKLALSREITRAFTGRWTSGEPKRLAAITSPSRLANRIIVGVKSVVKEYSRSDAGSSVTYKSVSNYFLSSYTREVRQILDRYDMERDEEADITSSLLVDLDVVFFVYSMDLRVRPTDWIARFVQMVLRFADALSAEAQYLLRKKVFDLTRHAIDVSLGVREKVSFVEIQNMLLVLSLLGEDFLLYESYLFRILDGFLQREQANMCSYFMWVTLMLYIRDLVRYDSLRMAVAKRMLERFERDEHCLESAELFMLFSDALACPWVDDSSKLRLLAVAATHHSGLPVKDSKQRAIIDMFRGVRLFVDWDDTDWASKRIEKKKYSFAYER